MKSQRGVSLVGLSLTIIVLLILAGVAVYMVIGPDGVLSTNKNEVNSSNTSTTSENTITNNNTNTNTNETENQNTTPEE